MTTSTSSWRNRVLQRTGRATLLIGALAVAIGIPQTSRAGGGNEACPTGTVLVSKFNYTDGSYVFEKPAGNESVVVITNGTATGGSWTSTTPIAVVIVKGGTGATSAAYNPAASSGTFTNAGLPLVGNGNVPDVSNVQFCGPSGSSDTTTTAATTTVPDTTVPPTTVPPTTPPTTVPVTTVPVTTVPVTTVPVTPVPVTTVPVTTVPVTTTPATSDAPTSVVTTTTLVAQLGPEPSTTIFGVSDASSPLPATGSQPSLLIAFGLLMLTIGLGLTMVDRMRHHR